jgi:hypothetical protein
VIHKGDVMTKRRLLRFAAAFCSSVIICAGVAPAVAGAASRAVTGGTLKIELSGVEKSAKVKALVTGPKFRKEIAGAVVLRDLRPGKYVVRPSATTQPNGVERPGLVARATVVKGKVATTTARYYFIPKTTHTIAKGQTLAISGPVTGTQRITLASSTQVAVGNILASGPTANRPKGYLVKVQSLSHKNGHIVAVVKNTTLGKAVPDGSLTMTKVAEELNRTLLGGATSNLRSDLKRAHDSTSLCSGSANITVAPSLTFSNFSGVQWNWHSASVGFTVTGSLQVSGSVAGSCSIPDDDDGGMALLSGEGETVPLDVGIPITVTPTYALIVSGTAQVSGSVSDLVSTSTYVTLGAGLGFTGINVSGSASPATFTSGPADSMGLTADLGLYAQVGFEIDYDVAGLSIDVGPKATLTVSPTASPWWVLQGCISGGWSGNALGFSFGDLSAFNLACATVAEAEAGAPVPPVTTTTTPTVPGTTSPSPIQGLPPLPDFLQNVTYGGGKFVALGVSTGPAGTNVAAYSLDGVNWYPVKLPASRSWNSVTYGGGRFVAVSSLGDNGKDRALAAYSSDGIHWSTVDLPYTNVGYQAVTYGGGRFVAIGQNTSGVAYSANGVTWKGVLMPASANWQSVTYGEGKFIAVSQNSFGTGTAGAYSTNGATWKLFALPTNSDWESVAYGNGMFEVIGGYGPNSVAYSTDGVHWTVGSLGGYGWWVAITYANGKFVAIGTSPGGQETSSTDGVHWTVAGLPGDDAGWSGVAGGNGTFVAVQTGPFGWLGYSYGAVAYSIGGAAWVPEGAVDVP